MLHGRSANEHGVLISDPRDLPKAEALRQRARALCTFAASWTLPRLIRCSLIPRSGAPVSRPVAAGVGVLVTCGHEDMEVWPLGGTCHRHLANRLRPPTPVASSNLPTSSRILTDPVSLYLSKPSSRVRGSDMILGTSKRSPTCYAIRSDPSAESSQATCRVPDQRHDQPTRLLRPNTMGVDDR